MRWWLVCAVAVGCVIATTANASAAIYRGSSTKGTSVKLRTNSKGKPTHVVFGPYEARCSNGYDPLRTPIGGFVPPFDAATPDRLVDRGTAHSRDGHNRVKGSWDFQARHTSEDHWTGRYSTHGKFMRDGEVYTRCAVSFRFDLKRR